MGAERCIVIDLLNEFNHSYTELKIMPSSKKNTKSKKTTSKSVSDSSGKKSGQLSERRGARKAEVIDSGEEESSENEEEEEEEEEEESVSNGENLPINVPRTVSTETGRSPTSTMVSLITEISRVGSITPAVRQRIKCLEETEKEVNIMKTENESLKRKIGELERQVEIYEMTRSKRAKKQCNAEHKQLLMEVQMLIRNKIGRVMKFPQKGWTLYSVDRNTVCGMILPELHLPVTVTSDREKKALWDCVIAPSLTRKLSVYKNRITQQMRDQFKCEYI